MYSFRDVDFMFNNNLMTDDSRDKLIRILRDNSMIKKNIQTATMIAFVSAYVFVKDTAKFTTTDENRIVEMKMDISNKLARLAKLKLLRIDGPAVSDEITTFDDSKAFDNQYRKIIESEMDKDPVISALLILTEARIFLDKNVCPKILPSIIEERKRDVVMNFIEALYGDRSYVGIEHIILDEYKTLRDTLDGKEYIDDDKLYTLSKLMTKYSFFIVSTVFVKQYPVKEEIQYFIKHIDSIKTECYPYRGPSNIDEEDSPWAATAEDYKSYLDPVRVGAPPLYSSLLPYISSMEVNNAPLESYISSYLAASRLLDRAINKFLQTDDYFNQSMNINRISGYILKRTIHCVAYRLVNEGRSIELPLYYN